MSNPKISIIVPVYKVESYLHKCIDSILAQTFEDFELILIDDGSPDQCGVICDEYANKDRRIRVIHKENGGLSSARNAGIDIAKGDYIGFVDSDDWIEPDMYKLLYEVCKKNDCEIASCSSMIHYKNRTVVNGTHPLTIHDKNQAMKAILEGDLYDEVVWTKLIDRKLLMSIRFPEGMVYEDTALTYKIVHKCTKVCSVGAPKYHYIKHENSTMDQAAKDIRIDAVFIYNEMYQFIAEFYPELKQLVALKLANSSMTILNTISRAQNSSQYRKEYNIVSHILNRYFGTTIKLKEYPRTVKALLFVTKIHPLLYKMFINLSARRKAV